MACSGHKERKYGRTVYKRVIACDYRARAMVKKALYLCDITEYMHGDNLTDVRSGQESYALYVFVLGT
jgi:hypothetical protein